MSNLSLWPWIIPSPSIRNDATSATGFRAATEKDLLGLLTNRNAIEVQTPMVPGSRIRSQWFQGVKVFGNPQVTMVDPLVICYIAVLQITMLFMGKSTMSMAIFQFANC